MTSFTTLARLGALCALAACGDDLRPSIGDAGGSGDGAPVADGAAADVPHPDAGAVDAAPRFPGQCSPVAQDCGSSTDGCYLAFRSGEGVCVPVPAPAQDLEQNDPCYGPIPDTCFLNGCARGFAAIVPDDPASTAPHFLCAFFCTPVATTLNQGSATTAVGGQALPGQYDCNADPGEERLGPGTGGSFECRFVNSFYADTGSISPLVGFCVETATWGSCTAFDLEACVASSDPANDPACAAATPGCVDAATLPAQGRASARPRMSTVMVSGDSVGAVSMSR